MLLFLQGMSQLRRLLPANESGCIYTSVTLPNGTTFNGTVCGNSSSASFAVDSDRWKPYVPYFLRHRKKMTRPPISMIPTIVPGALIGRLVTSRTDLDIQSAQGTDITMTPGLGGKVFVHSEVEYALRAGPSVIRATADLVNISTPGRAAMHSGEAVDITTPQLDIWTTNVTTEALENIRMFTSNLTIEAWENVNTSVAERATTTAEDILTNVLDTIDTSATNFSLGIGDVLDIVAQNKSQMLTTDMWVAAGHMMDTYAQDDIYVSTDRITTKTAESVEISTDTATLFANDSLRAFVVNDTSLVSTDVTVVAGRNATVHVGRTFSVAAADAEFLAKSSLRIDAGRELAVGTDVFVLEAYTRLQAATTDLSVHANRSIEVDSAGEFRLGSETLDISVNEDMMLALGGAATAVAGGDVFVGAGGDLTVDVSQHAMLTADSAMVDLTHAPWAQQRLLYWEPGGGFELNTCFHWI